MRTLHFILWVFIAGSPCLGRGAVAQAPSTQVPSDVDLATARELGNDAWEALDRNDYVTAEDLATRALSLYQAPTLYQARALARRNLGKLVSAAEDYRAVLRFAVSPAEPSEYKEARASARSELDRLEPQVPHLTLFTHEAPSSVTVNGSEWSAAVLGVARPLDPGVYVIEAHAADGAKASYHIVLNAGQNRQLSIEFVRPEVAQPATPQPLKEPKKSVNRTPFYILAATTAVLVGGAVATGIVALNRRAEFNRENRADVAMARKESLHSQAKTWGLVNTGLWVGALASAGVSAYVFFSAGPEEGAQNSKKVTWQVGMRGQF